MRLKKWVHAWQRLARRFGINVASNAPPNPEQDLLSLLDRLTPLDALEALEFSLSTAAPAGDALSLNDTAIALDTNILLKLAGHQRSAEVADYLSTRLQAPLILPGQVIQEFWNNHVGGLMTVANKIEGKLSEVQQLVNELDPQSTLATSIKDLRDKTLNEYDFLYDAGLVNKTKSMIATLRTRARVPFARRSTFASTSELRKITKTPPGFRDSGHGDFYVWVDLLTGLQQARAEGETFVRVAMITNDVKPDWSRNGMAHPILTAEVKSLFGVPLEIWKLERLVDEVARAVSA